MLKRLPLFSYIFCLLYYNFKDPVKKQTPLPLKSLRPPTRSLDPPFIRTIAYYKLWYDDTIILVPKK